MTPEPSVRALLAQWREKSDTLNRSANILDKGASDGYEACADELEAALKPLADLAAEMQRFAEEILRHSQSYESQAEGRSAEDFEFLMDLSGLTAQWSEQALAWAARLKELQQ